MDGTGTPVAAGAGAPEALRGLYHRTVPGERVTVRTVGPGAAAWAARRLEDCLVGAGFTDVAGGPTPAVAEAVRDRSLADSVGPGLRMLCVGLNPSLVAADAGVAYGGASNRFWPAAVAAGLVPAPAMSTPPWPPAWA